jgi:hypothetical protein
VFAGLIAANLPDGGEVLTATGDFTSILSPFYVRARCGIPHPGGAAGAHRGVVTSATTLVAVSAVQFAAGGSPIWMPCTPPAAPPPSSGMAGTRAASPDALAALIARPKPQIAHEAPVAHSARSTTRSTDPPERSAIRTHIVSRSAGVPTSSGATRASGIASLSHDVLRALTSASC